MTIVLLMCSSFRQFFMNNRGEVATIFVIGWLPTEIAWRKDL
jgi:hypothetical protein